MKDSEIDEEVKKMFLQVNKVNGVLNYVMSLLAKINMLSVKVSILTSLLGASIITNIFLLFLRR